MFPGHPSRRSVRAAPNPSLAFAVWVLGVLVALPGAAARAAPGEVAPGGSFVLTVTVLGEGSGTISSEAGLACGASCSANFPGDTTVTLTAAPAPGSSFRGWRGACTGDGDCVLTMSSDLYVTATFTSDATTAYPLRVTRSGTGEGTVIATYALGGLYCGGGECSGSFPSGSSVTLTAVPAAGSAFGGWGLDCVGTGTCIVTMTTGRWVSVNFTPPDRTLRVGLAGTGSGTVTVAPPCDLPCTFRDGAIVTVTATPDADSTFESLVVHLQGGGDGSFHDCRGNTCRASLIGGDVSMVATFTARGAPPTPCADPVEFLHSSGGFGTTGPICLRTRMSVRGWGCSSFDGRTVRVNDGPATSACGAGPFPLPSAADGYTYFTISAGAFPWSTLFAWTW